MEKINKKITLIVLGFLVIVLIVLFISGNNFVSPEPTPTITFTTPTNNSQTVVEDSDIKIVFEDELSQKEASQINAKSTPEVTFIKTWVDTNTLLLTPRDDLQNDTEYKIGIYFKDKEIDQITFRTELYSKEEVRLQGIEQSENDKLFNEDLKETFDEMPWLEKLPIKTEEFTIVYDFNEQSLRIRLLIPESSPEQTKTNLQQKALENIEETGINAGEITYYFLYQ